VFEKPTDSNGILTGSESGKELVVQLHPFCGEMLYRILELRKLEDELAYGTESILFRHGPHSSDAKHRLLNHIGVQ